MAVTLENAPAVMAAGIGRQSDYFADPFADYASLSMPTSIPAALKLCQFLLSANHVYRQALERVVSYFITDVEITDPDADPDEVDKTKELMHESLSMRENTRIGLLDYLCYGNGFFSVLMPFRRYLSCGQCRLEAPLQQVFNGKEFKFHWQDCDFTATCPKCNYTGHWNHTDRRSDNVEEIVIKRWNPLDIELIHDPVTDVCSYSWRIPEDYRAAVKAGKSLHILERVPWEVVEAIKSNHNLGFDRDVVLHLKEPALAGFRTGGWGLSRVLTNFRQAWYVQVLYRYNEALALDYIVPFRVITPEPKSGATAESDPFLGTDMSEFVSAVEGMLALRRKDPARWNVLPYSLKYQALGGDANNFATKDQLDQGQDSLLNGIGVPVDLYRGSLTTQGAPIGTRLFESQWSSLVQARDRLLRFVIRRVSSLLSWEPLNARWRPVTIVDDADKQAAKLQLMMSKQLSQTTGLSTIDANFKQENRQMIAEQKQIAEMQAEAQKEMEQAQQAEQLLSPEEQGPVTGGGGGGAAGQFAAAQPTQPTQPTTPQEMEQRATTIAESMITMPDSARRSAMLQLQKSDPFMGKLVSSTVEQMRGQINRQAGAEAMAQQQQKTAATGLMYLRRRLIC